MTISLKKQDNDKRADAAFGLMLAIFLAFMSVPALVFALCIARNACEMNGGQWKPLLQYDDVLGECETKPMYGDVSR